MQMAKSICAVVAGIEQLVAEMQAIDGDESIGPPAWPDDDDDDNWLCAAAQVITSSSRSVKLEQMYKLVVLRYQINIIGRQIWFRKAYNMSNGPSVSWFYQTEFIFEF